MTFGGWPAEALEFYAGLEDDNSKSYWTSHKAVYDEKVLRPMTELVEQLSPEFGEPKIFRPYRDIRFSADKTLYKTHIIAVIEKAGHEVHGHGTLKSAPRGYPAEHPRIGLLRHKGLTAWQHWGPAPWLQTASAAERLQSFFRTGAALSSWLTLNVSG